VEGKLDNKREVLAARLRGASDPVTARGNLRRILADLRRLRALPTGKVALSAGNCRTCFDALSAKTMAARRKFAITKVRVIYAILRDDLNRMLNCAGVQREIA
jgi:hypothetical protein